MRLVRLDLTTFEIRASQILPVANSLECWCVALSPPTSREDEEQTAVLYSGGDDSVLRYISLSMPSDIDDSVLVDVPYPPAVMKKDHEAGVTAILPLPLYLEDGSRIVMTGSYDENLRIFAMQDPQTTFGLKRTRLLADHGLGGGVWRLKVIKIDKIRGSEPSWKIRLLASCMHAGTRIVDVSISHDGTASVEVLYRFEEHKSMNYGSDWIQAVDERGINVVSTSFYDRLLCLWQA